MIQQGARAEGNTKGSVSCHFTDAGTLQEGRSDKLFSYNSSRAMAFSFRAQGNRRSCNQSRRAWIRRPPLSFMSSCATVARPVAVKPSKITPVLSHRKCLPQMLTRGLTRLTDRPVIGSTPVTWSDLAWLQAAQASALFPALFEPPCE